MEFKGTKGKWECKEFFKNFIVVDENDNVVNINQTQHNALLISKAPEMLFELNETLKELLVLQGNIYESSKIDKKWDGMYDLIQTWIDRKKELIKEATEIN